MKDEQYLQLIGKYPQITSEGYGVNMFYANGLSRRKYFALRRDELPGYFHIPRGVFILAALYKRYDVTKMENSTDAWIGVPE